jgi:hypothetical protein
VAHDVVDMPVEEDPRQWFCEVICFINCSIDAFQDNEVPLNPLTEDVVPNVHVAGATSWFLRVSHSRTSIIVFVEPAGCLLGNVEVPKDAVHVKKHFAQFVCGHEFRLGGGGGNGILELSLVSHRCASKFD